MFFCILLNQFVCLFKIGKITEIDSIVSSKFCGFPNFGAYDQLVEESLRAMPDLM
jgi:hypothetical protein